MVEQTDRRHIFYSWRKRAVGVGSAGLAMIATACGGSSSAQPAGGVEQSPAPHPTVTTTVAPSEAPEGGCSPFLRSSELKYSGRVVLPADSEYPTVETIDPRQGQGGMWRVAGSGRSWNNFSTDSPTVLRTTVPIEVTGSGFAVECTDPSKREAQSRVDDLDGASGHRLPAKGVIYVTLTDPNVYRQGEYKPGEDGYTNEPHNPRNVPVNP